MYNIMYMTLSIDKLIDIPTDRGEARPLPMICETSEFREKKSYSKFNRKHRGPALAAGAPGGDRDIAIHFHSNNSRALAVS